MVAANPIRKVVTMLQQIEKKVEAEGAAEEKLFEKYMCYCKSSGGGLKAGIDASTAKVPEVESAIKEAEAQKEQLGEDLTKHRSDREAAKSAMAEATSLREKDAGTFAAYKAETEANIAAVNGAVASLEKGMAGSFLQSPAVNAVIKAVKARESMLETDRQDVLAFLSGSSSSDYAPSSGEITGILKQMGETMSKDLAEASSTESGSITDYDGLMAAKKKEVEACTAAIEDKTVREGEVAVSIAQMKNDLSDTEEALVEDKKFLADLEKNCKTKEAEWDEIVKTRAEELTALAETIKLLNDDDALELFKKTLPSASSFVQVQVSTDSARQSALSALRVAQKGAKNPKLDFIALALRGKKMGFEKVISMIDEMAEVLKKEQVDDNNKKEYCEVQFDSLEDSKKELERSVSDSEKAIEDSKEAISTLTSEISALEDGIKALDKDVAEATAQRKAENEDFTTLMAQDTAAKELIGVAKNRLNKFYNPKLYVAPPKRELSREDRIAVNMGGTMAPTPAPGGIAGTGITVLADVSVHSQTAPPPAPDAPGPFKKKSEESNGVIAMMDLLIADLDKEMTVAEQEEKDAQADYEEMQNDSADKRAADSKSLTEKAAAKGDTEEMLQGHTDSLTSASSELMATEKVIMQTHAECDWLLQYFDVRKEARDGELEALSKAKAVLSGADYSLLQTKTARKLRGSA
jgi:outer membrane murein-binding lipoprotein Lpp